MITVGIDLATEPAKTAACVLKWDPRPAAVAVRMGVDDETAVRLALEGDKCAIDAPFGWPRPFVEFVRAHEAAEALPPSPPPDLQLRTTDRWVEQAIGIRPLSVSANLIGATAMRCARLLEAIANRRGEAIDRSGAGLVVEGYPAAALEIWDLRSRGYKGTKGRENLRVLAGTVIEQVGIDVAPEQCAVLASKHDAFDALICALVARAAALGNTLEPSDLGPARVEGWIHLPDPTLGMRSCLGL